MPTRLLLIAAVSSAVAIAAGTALASGGQNAYGNPTGEPAEDTYQNPFSNSGEDGRMQIWCAEDETLVITPAEGGVMEATCVPAD
jgi:hypothetical protein